MRILEPAPSRRRLTVACRAGAAALLALAAAAWPTQAQRRSQEALDAVRAERALRQAERDRYLIEADTAARELTALRLSLAQLGAAQVSGEAEVSARRAGLETLAQREAALAGRLNANRADFARVLGALQAYSRNPPPALLVSPRSALDAARATILLRAVQPELTRRAAGYRAEAEALALARRRLAVAGSAVIAAESDVAERRSRIEAMIRERAALERRLLADATAADSAVQELAVRARSLGELTDALPATPAAIVAALPALQRPAAGRIVRSFTSDLPGLTLRTEPGAQVVSPWPGRVDYAGPLRGYGAVLILRAPGGYHVVLAGMDVVVSATGRTLAAGEPIGRMASGTGSAALGGGRDGPAPELYVEVRRAGVPVDPARFLTAAEGRP